MPAPPPMAAPEALFLNVNAPMVAPARVPSMAEFCAEVVLHAGNRLNARISTIAYLMGSSLWALSPYGRFQFMSNDHAGGMGIEMLTFFKLWKGCPLFQRELIAHRWRNIGA